MTRIAAISDLHLGNATSYLNLESVRNRLYESLNRPPGTKLDALFLVGDIMDLTVGYYPEPWLMAKQFFQLLGKPPLVIDRIFYIPGNHDHHVWVMLVENKEILVKLRELKRGPKGTLPPYASLETRYGFWTPLHELFPANLCDKVTFAYPFHCFPYPNGPRFVFHHGHFFDRAITPLAGFAAKRYHNLQKIEALNMPYIEALFHSFTWDPMLQKAELACYSMLTRIGHSFLARLYRLTCEKMGLKHPALGECNLKQIDTIMTQCHFRDTNVSEQDIWVFGHTHFSAEKKSESLAMYNLGGWVLNHDPTVNTKSAWSTPAILHWDEKGDTNMEEFELLDNEKKQIVNKILALEKNVQTGLKRQKPDHESHGGS